MSAWSELNASTCTSLLLPFPNKHSSAVLCRMFSIKIGKQTNMGLVQMTFIYQNQEKERWEKTKNGSGRWQESEITSLPAHGHENRGMSRRTGLGNISSSPPNTFTSLFHTQIHSVTNLHLTLLLSKNWSSSLHCSQTPNKNQVDHINHLV